MAITMKLWKINREKLRELPKEKLNKEERLENWIEEDISILGLDLLIIGRQVPTDFGGKIDILGMNRNGDVVILELKRDKTPREIVAQILDYASWVKDLLPKDIEEIARKYTKKGLSDAFSEHFEIDLPESINSNHGMIIIASQLDDSSERIVHYLTNYHRININAIFFNFFHDNGSEFLGRSWLMDPEEVEEIAESRRKGPWSGYWFVNVGEGVHRNWDDCKEYGFLSAGQGRKYSTPLRKLKVGDYIFAYLKGRGYVGYGQVTSEAIPVPDFEVKSFGKKLLELPLKQPNIKDNADNPDLSEYIVGINWIKTFDRDEARKVSGIFANQNIVCKLRDQQTLDFIFKEFLIEKI